MFHCEEPSYWETYNLLFVNPVSPKDSEMALRALHLRALSVSTDPEKKAPLTFEQSLNILKRFNKVQFQIFEEQFFDHTIYKDLGISSEIPDPVETPHWIRPKSKTSALFTGSKRWYDSREEAIEDLQLKFDELREKIKEAKASAEKPEKSESQQIAEDLVGEELEEEDEVEIKLSDLDKQTRFTLHGIYEHVSLLLLTGILKFKVKVDSHEIFMRYVSSKEMFAQEIISTNTMDYEKRILSKSILLRIS